VCGQLRTYKIHLGSGNILMESNDQYLCIVPDRKPDRTKEMENVFLPFEGDSLLSVILSKRSSWLMIQRSRIRASFGRLQVEADELLAMSEPKAYRIPIEPLRWEAQRSVGSGTRISATAGVGKR